MNTFTIVLLVILAIMIIALVVLYILGKRAEKRQAEQEEQIKASAQQVDILVIDKKMMRIKDAGLPSVVMEQTPWYLRRSKLPIVKAKIGPQIRTMIAAEDVYELIPVKKQVRATVSGLYITQVKAIRGSLEKPAPKKKGIRGKIASLYEKSKAGAAAAQGGNTAKDKKKK